MEGKVLMFVGAEERKVLWELKEGLALEYVQVAEEYKLEVEEYKLEVGEYKPEFEE